MLKSQIKKLYISPIIVINEKKSLRIRKKLFIIRKRHKENFQLKRSLQKSYQIFMGGSIFSINIFNKGRRFSKKY
jgi:hypothetical protein